MKLVSIIMQNWSLEAGTCIECTALTLYHVAGVSRLQVQNWTHLLKMSTFWNFMTIFGIIMRNEFKRVQTCLVLVHFIHLFYKIEQICFKTKQTKNQNFGISWPLFGITMRNAFKRVQTCLVLVHLFYKIEQIYLKKK